MAMRVLPAILCTLTATGAVRAAEIAPGVAVDGRGSAVFLMSPARRVEARDVVTGALRWSSAEAVRPLAAAAGRLLAQADAPEGRLDLVILDALSGRRVASQSMTLPDAVSAPIDEVLGTRFELRVLPSGPQVRLEWTWERRPVRGALLVDEEEDVLRAAGAVVVDLPAGRFTTAAARPPAEGPAPLPPSLAAEADAGAFRQRPQRVGARLVATQGTPDGRLLLKRWTEAGVPLPDAPLPSGVTLQRGSVDGRHVLVSQPVAGASADRAHAWTVLDLDTGFPVASLATSTAAAPFAVVGGRVLVVQEAMGHRAAAGWQEQPRRIEAFDAATGAPAWAQPVRDTAYHGPFAP
jgi:hypothetical protein